MNILAAILIAIVAVAFNSLLPMMWFSTRWAVRIVRLVIAAGTGYAAGIIIGWLL